MKSGLFLVVVVLLVDVLWAQDVVISCSTPSRILCEPKGVDEIFKSGKHFPDADMLNRHCGEVVRAIECLVDYEKACPSEVGYMVGTQDKTQDILNLVKDVCDKDSLVGKGYREHVDCLNTHGDDLTMCSRDTRYNEIFFREYLVREHGNMTEEDDDKVDCLVNMMIYSCLEDTFQQKCGDEARDLILGLLDRVRSTPKPICTPENMIQIEERFAAYLAEEAEKSRKK